MSSVVSIGYYNTFNDCGTLVLIVEEGNYAEQYAKENDIPFEVVTK